MMGRHSVATAWVNFPLDDKTIFNDAMLDGDSSENVNGCTTTHGEAIRSSVNLAASSFTAEMTFRITHGQWI